MVPERKGNSNAVEPLEDWKSQETASERRTLYSWKKRRPSEIKHKG